MLLTGLRLFALPAALLAGVAASLPAAAQVTLIPHRAVYELRLSQARGGAGSIDQVRGRIVYQFTGDACDGYALNFRQVTEIGNGEGQTNVSDLRSETWEDGAGKSFRFQAQNFLNDQLDRDTDGRAERAGDAVKVTVSKPNRLSNSYEARMLFPTEHLVKIIEAAHARQTLLQASVYDGSEAGDKTFDTLAVIGKPADAPPAGIEAPARRPELEKETYWPISISYFERGKKTDGEQTPDYQMSFDLYANGISRALKIDYGDFVIDGDLKELEIMKPTPCKK
jgi:hypothetical protein